MTDSGIKLSTLLPLASTDIESALKEHLATGPVVATPIATVFGLASEAAASKISEALDVDLLELLSGAWVKVQALKEYKDAVKHPPEKTSIVHLGEHEITSTLEPVLQIDVAKVPLPAMRLTVELAARFKSVALTVQGGCIWSVGTGECSARVRLKYKSKLLKEMETPGLKFPGQISLGRGIAIP